MNSSDTTPAMAAASSLIDALHTDRPASDRADKMSLYGWLIGGWKMDAGASPRSQPTPFTGSASARLTMAPLGSSRPNFSPAASQLN
jgi:hypothetical protein